MFRTGLAERIAAGIVEVSGAESLWAITALATAIGIALSELTSNTLRSMMRFGIVMDVLGFAIIQMRIFDMQFSI